MPKRDLHNYDLELHRNHIFVFGSNMAGRHGREGAYFAKRYCGAIYGRSSGRQGNSYAIPTKDAYMFTLSLNVIKMNVNSFIAYATAYKDLKFFITRIGCGLAGYKDMDIAPMFAKLVDNPNCLMHPDWVKTIRELQEPPNLIEKVEELDIRIEEIKRQITER